MKKTFFLAVLLSGIIACALVIGDSQYRTSPGRKAPALWVPENQGRLSLRDLQGHYVLLNFWKSTDAPSRRAANEYTAWIRRNPGLLKLISINLDESQALFNEIVRLDSLIPETQYHADGKYGKAISDTYQLEYGLGSLLIDPDGIITGHNPTQEALSALTKI